MYWDIIPNILIYYIFIYSDVSASFLQDFQSTRTQVHQCIRTITYVRYLANFSYPTLSSAQLTASGHTLW